MTAGYSRTDTPSRAMADDDVIYRGWVVLVISIILFIIFGGFQSTWGTIILCLQQDISFPEASLPQLGLPLTVFFAFQLCLSNLVYLALSRLGQHSLRFILALGMVLTTLGLLLTSFANGAQSVTVPFGVISGTGFGLLVMCTYLVIDLWFPWTHRFHVLTTSSLCAIFPMGTAIMTFTTTKMCADPSVGWRWAFRVYAAVFGVLSLLLMVLYGHPPLGVSEQTGCSGVDCHGTTFLQKPPWSMRAKVAIFALWTISMCCKGYGYFLPFVILPKHLEDLGYKKEEAVYAMTVLGISGMIGQIFSSFVGDHIKGNLMLVNLIAATLLAINNIVMAYSTSLTFVVVYCAVAGLGLGPYNAGYYSVHYEIMSGDNVATLFLTTRFSKGVGSTVGPYLGEYIRTVTGNYQHVFFSIASCFAVFATTTGVIIFINKWRNLKSLELMKNGSISE